MTYQFDPICEGTDQTPLVAFQAMGLHLPPPPDSDEEEDPEGAAAQRSEASIPMDAGEAALLHGPCSS